jgi:hypothetical protein
MRKVEWSDLSKGKRRLAIKAGVAAAIFGVIMLIDLKRRPADQIRGPKWAWVPLAFVDFIGPIVYFVYGRRRQGSCCS